MNRAAIDDFAEFLLGEMIATESTAFADDILAAAKAKIAGKGELSFLTTGTINGKTFARSKELSAIEVARGARLALKMYADFGDGGTLSGSTLDFSGLTTLG